MEKHGDRHGRRVGHLVGESIKHDEPPVQVFQIVIILSLLATTDAADAASGGQTI